MVALGFSSRPAWFQSPKSQQLHSSVILLFEIWLAWRDATCNQDKSPQPLVLRLSHASHRSLVIRCREAASAPIMRVRSRKRGSQQGHQSFLSTLQPKRRAHGKDITHTLCQPFNQKLGMLIRTGEGNVGVAARSDQPSGDLWTATCFSVCKLCF